MKFSSKNQRVFLNPSSGKVISLEKGKKVDIILSPSLYWVKKVTLPIKSVREVKKLLPSIFEESLPEGHYSYYAYKSEDDFIAFAYEDKKILEAIHEAGITTAQIGALYFAQSEFEEIQTVVQVSDTSALYVKEKLLLLAPLTWFKECEKLALDSLKLSKHKISLQQYGHIIDPKSLYKIGVLLSLFALILGGELFIAKSKLDSIEVKKAEIFSKYKLQSSTLQNESALKKYTKIYTTQIKLRKYLSLFLKLPLNKTQKIILVDYKNRILSITISGVKKGMEGSIVSMLKREKIENKLSFHKDSIKVEIKL
jgi:hypothetical protein